MGCLCCFSLCVLSSVTNEKQQRKAGEHEGRKQLKIILCLQDFNFFSFSHPQPPLFFPFPLAFDAAPTASSSSSGA